MSASSLTDDAEPLFTPAEVAALFRVSPKTVTRWANAGKLTPVRTLGGHHRYRKSEVRELLAGGGGQYRGPDPLAATLHGAEAGTKVA
jgi:excisionase family DNA binding protein